MEGKQVVRKLKQQVLRSPRQFDLTVGYLASLLMILGLALGWWEKQAAWGRWLGVLASTLSIVALVAVTRKISPAGVWLNHGLAGYEPKRGGQIAVLYGAVLFGLGVFALSPFPYYWLEPTGSYGLAVLLGGALVLGGVYIVVSTPILEPAHPMFEADALKAQVTAWNPDEEITSKAEVSEVQPKCAVPRVTTAAAAKRPSDLLAADILDYMLIEGDWVDTPASYTCVTVEAGWPTPVSPGDVVGINHARSDPGWLQGKWVAAWLDGNRLVIGVLERAGELLRLQPRRDTLPPVTVPAVALIGAIEWSVKPDLKSTSSRTQTDSSGHPPN